MPAFMQQAYIIYFRYKAPTDKSAPVRQYRVYAESLEEARKLAAQYANYPHIQVLDVKQA